MIWMIFIGTMALSLWAMWRVKSVYKRYSQGTVRSGLTGGEVAAQILRRTGIRDVNITVGEGMLGDHYDPIHKRLVLSPDNYHGRSPAALGVAAHECGHAIQHARAYKPDANATRRHFNPRWKTSRRIKPSHPSELPVRHLSEFS